MRLVRKVMFLFLVFGLFFKSAIALTVAPVDIRTMDIKDLNKAMEQGIITSEQLVNIYLERINEYNKSFLAIAFLNENAIKEAKELDKMRQDGVIKGELHGIPIVVKTNIDVLGLPTTAGAKALEDNYPKNDADVIKKLKDAGAIILGTTNMSEFAFSAKDSFSSYGTVKNAFNSLYSSYGSSGGSAVAVALSFAAASLGTDTNSSIRVPASAANLVGFRPSFGLISTKGVIAYDTTRDVVGPITKTVSDSAIMMSILTGNDYTKLLSVNGLNGKTIGVATELYIGSNASTLEVNQKTYPPITDLMTAKITQMKAQGAKIVEIEKLYTDYYFSIARSTLGGLTMCDGFTDYIKGTNGTIRTFKELVSSPKKVYSLDGYLDGCNLSATVKNNWAKKKGEYEEYVAKIFKDNDLDVLIYPTTKNKLSTLSNNQNPLVSPGTNITSVIGYTSVSVPLGFDNDNLPYGLEFLTTKNNEEILFEIISGYESLNNEMIVSELASSLYEVSESVISLVKNYQNLLEQNKLSDLEKSFAKEVRTYFEDYQGNENKEDEAQILNQKYEELNKPSIFIDSINPADIIKIVIILVVLFYIIGQLVIVYKKTSKKKKKRN